MSKTEKPTLDELNAAVASGKGTPVKVVVYGVEIEGNTFWVTDSGVVLDKFIVVRDTSAGYVREERKSGFDRVAKYARTVAAFVLKHYKLPIATKLLGKVGVRPETVEAVMGVLARRTADKQLEGIMKLASPRRWSSAYDLYNELKKDGLTWDEIQEIVKIAKG